MSPLRGVVAVSLAAAVAAGALLWLQQPPPVPESVTATAAPAYELRRVIRYGFELRNTTGRAMRDVAFEAFAPVRETSVQRCCNRLSASHPFEIGIDALGNQTLRFGLGVLAPYATVLVRVEAELALAPSPAVLAGEDSGRFTGPEPLVETGDRAVRARALALAAGSPEQTVRAVFDWTAASIHSDGYLRRARGAAFALSQRRGDCTEHAHALTALLRVNGIPARVMTGFVVPADGTLTPEGLHSWAEVLVDGRWRVGDSHGKRLMHREYEYLAFWIGSDADTAEAGGFARFRHRSEGLEVRMVGT